MLFREGNKLFSEQGTSQGDPIAIGLSAHIIIPLLSIVSSTTTSAPSNGIENSSANQFHEVVFADYFTSSCKLELIGEFSQF